MSTRSIASWLGVNRNLRSDGGDFRFLQLPRMNPFPKLNRPVVVATTPAPGPRRPVRTGAIIGGNGTLPEMTSDVIDPSTSYAVTNVKRHDTRGGWGKTSFGLLLSKVTGGHHAARL